MPVINQTRDIVLAERVEIAATWPARLRGLLGRDRLPASHCLVLDPCHSIHTCFLRFNIDALFVSAGGEIVFLVENMPPFRFSPLIRRARLVVELPAHTVSSSGTAVGDRVTIQPE